MTELAGRLTGALVAATDRDAELLRDFEARLGDSSTLAFRVAYSVVRQRQDAEDVAQEAFARAYRNFASLRDRERFRAWLVRMTWRIALDHRRAAVRRLRREDAVAALATSVRADDDVLARERSRQLWAAIDALPARLRMAVVLSSIEGHDTKEVSSLLGIPAGTVKSRLFEARRKLQEALR
jgi:RNA polymerase sigma-70 factor (ECF subfamily)